MLAGRFRLEERLRASPDGAVWRAVDQTLERSVAVHVLSAAHPATREIIEASRRSALVEDPRLARILDVGHGPRVTYIVTENVSGQPLSSVAGGTPVPAETARRLIGEAAQALARADAHGLHHLRLAPESLIVDDDGSIRVIGTAIDAAVHGESPGNRDLARRTDAVGLVSLLYAALTGRWPGTIPSSLPPAPRVGGRPVPPAELVAGVSADLDELCTWTLGDGGAGPSSPAEVADALGPWARMEPLTDPSGLTLAAPARERPAPVTGPIRVQAEDAGADVEAAPPTPPRISFGLRAELLERSVRARTEAAGAPAAETPPRGVSGSASSVVTPPRGTAAAAGTPAPETGPIPVRPAPSPAELWRDWASMGIPVPEEEPVAPFIPPVPVDRPPSDQSRFVIMVVVGFVVFILIVAVFSLRNFGQGGGLLPVSSGTVQPTPTTAGPTAPGTQPATPASATTTATAPVTASPEPTTSSPPQIAGIQAIDPQGDGQENGSQAMRAIDGDSATKWKSNFYSGADFSGLKSGVGLVLDVGDSSVQQVTIDAAGSGGTVELRTAPGPGIDGTAVVATAPIESGHAVLTPSKAVTSQFLVLWFTKLPKASGKYQLVVSEINVR